MSKTTVSITNGTVHIENVYDGIWAIPYNISDDGEIDGHNVLIGEIDPTSAMLLGKALAKMVLASDEIFKDDFTSTMFQLGFHGHMSKELNQ